MKNLILYLIIIAIIPFERFFIPGFEHAFSFSILLFLNFTLQPAYSFPLSFIYALAIESFVPDRVWVLPFYFALLPFFIIWIKRNINYKITVVFFILALVIYLSFFSLIYPGFLNILNTFIFSVILTAGFKLWKRKYPES